ncbi:MAG: hypothetical protein J6D47_00130 [Peptostreptococcaceae bacterium]|nr:hypothetical protein [Peptostreptococcaceae bacterium]
MTDRDKAIVQFINEYELCTKEHIKELFFPECHANVCMRRLKKLAEDELINRFKYNGNVFIYYASKKPSKRLINHDMYITDFIVKMIKQGYEIIEFKKSFTIGNIISDAYIRYKDQEGTTRHLVLEIQLHNKVEDCILKYTDFKNIILDNRKEWNSIPRIICITDMKDRIQLKGLKVLYDSTEMNNLDEVLRG